MNTTNQTTQEHEKTTKAAGGTAWATTHTIEALSLDEAAREVVEDSSFQPSPADLAKLRRAGKHQNPDTGATVVPIRLKLCTDSPSEPHASAGGGTASTLPPNPRRTVAASFRPVTGGAVLRATADKMSESQRQRDQEFKRRQEEWERRQEEKARRKAEDDANPEKQAARARTKFMDGIPLETKKLAIEGAATYILDGIPDTKVWAGCNNALKWWKKGVLSTVTPNAFLIVPGCDPAVAFEGVPFQNMFVDGRWRSLLGDEVARQWARQTADYDKKPLKPVHAKVSFNEVKGIVKLDLTAYTDVELAAHKAETDAAEAARTVQAEQDAETARAEEAAEEARREQDAKENPWGAAAGGGGH